MTEDKKTIAVYDKNVEQYKNLIGQSYKDKNLDFFEKMLNKKSVVLDLGCGTGQVSSKLQSLGHILFPVDASLEMIKVAKSEFHLNAVHRTFDQINEVEAFDGIWANFSLLHTSKKSFAENLAKLFYALKPQGILFFSLKYGFGEKRDSLGRYYSYYTEVEVLKTINQTGFKTTNQTSGKSKGLAGQIEKWIGFFCTKD